MSNYTNKWEKNVYSKTQQQHPAIVVDLDMGSIKEHA